MVRIDPESTNSSSLSMGSQIDLSNFKDRLVLRDLMLVGSLFTVIE